MYIVDSRHNQFGDVFSLRVKKVVSGIFERIKHLYFNTNCGIIYFVRYRASLCVSPDICRFCGADSAGCMVPIFCFRR